MIMLITACLISNMSICKEESLNIGHEITSQRQCTTVGQAILAGWQGMHPERKIVGWKCVDEDKVERRI